jgi:hypothetical protein
LKTILLFVFTVVYISDVSDASIDFEDYFAILITFIDVYSVSIDFEVNSNHLCRLSRGIALGQEDTVLMVKPTSLSQ